MPEQPADPGPPDAEALRRRLYVPGASPADVDAYRRAARPVDPAPPVDAPAPARGGPSRRLLLGLGALALGTGAAGGAAAVLLTRAPGPPRIAPADLGLGPADREELLANLARGGAAGISAYLVTHPSPPPLADATRFVTVELHGTGPGSRPLAPTGVGGRAGRATVLLVVARSGDAGWTAFRLGTAGSPIVRLLPVGARGGVQAAGALTAAVLRHAAGRRPVRLAVAVPDGVRWGAAVVFSD